MSELSENIFRDNLEKLIPLDIDLRNNIATSLKAGEVSIAKDEVGKNILIRNGISYNDTHDAISESKKLATNILNLTHVTSIGFFGIRWVADRYQPLFYHFLNQLLPKYDND